MDLYIFSPFGPICWFCSLVLTKSNGKTHDTPMIPAIPPFIIFGSNLKYSNEKLFHQIIFPSLTRTVLTVPGPSSSLLILQNFFFLFELTQIVFVLEPQPLLLLPFFTVNKKKSRTKLSLASKSTTTWTTHFSMRSLKIFSF